MDMDRNLLNRTDSALLIVDIQERLFSAMPEKIRPLVLRNTGIMIETAKVMGIPIIVSEQYRKGLGDTVVELSRRLEGVERLEKLYFDCMRDEGLGSRLRGLGRRKVLITGIEAHVCVFQTAVTLLSEGLIPVIVSDAVASRRTHDWRQALTALAGAGAVVYPTETVAFMLMEKAGTPEFKTLAPLFK